MCAQETITTDTDVLDMANSWSGWADAMIVGSGTAAGTHSLILKALASTGCPTWQARADASPSSPIVVWCYTSDRGSDQVAFENMTTLTRNCFNDAAAGRTFGPEGRPYIKWCPQKEVTMFLVLEEYVDSGMSDTKQSRDIFKKNEGEEEAGAAGDLRRVCLQAR